METVISRETKNKYLRDELRTRASAILADLMAYKEALYNGSRFKKWWYKSILHAPIRLCCVFVCSTAHTRYDIYMYGNKYIRAEMTARAALLWIRRKFPLDTAIPFINALDKKDIPIHLWQYNVIGKFPPEYIEIFNAEDMHIDRALWRQRHTPDAAATLLHMIQCKYPIGFIVRKHIYECDSRCGYAIY
jgi:hypothetical protein